MPIENASPIRWIIALCLITLAGSVRAHNPTSGFDLARSVTRADLVVFATVAEVTYAMSDPSPAQPPVPHTFVTFEIRDTLLGVRLKQVTLRFLGGLDERTDEILMVPVFPAFDIGDTSFLLVQGNTASECPLVDCAGGRFRVIADRVYTETGKPVLGNDKGGLEFGPRVALNEVALRRFGKFSLGTVSQTEKSDDAGGEPRNSAPPRGRHLTSAEFAQVLRQAIAATGTARGNRPVVPNADPRQKFSFEAPDAAPPKSDRPAAPRGEQGQIDDREATALRESGGSPVVTAKPRPIDRNNRK